VASLGCDVTLWICWREGRDSVRTERLYKEGTEWEWAIREFCKHQTVLKHNPEGLLWRHLSHRASSWQGVSGLAPAPALLLPIPTPVLAYTTEESAPIFAGPEHWLFWTTTFPPLCFHLPWEAAMCLRSRFPEVLLWNLSWPGLGCSLASVPSPSPTGLSVLTLSYAPACQAISQSSYPASHHQAPPTPWTPTHTETWSSNLGFALSPRYSEFLASDWTQSLRYGRPQILHSILTTWTLQDSQVWPVSSLFSPHMFYLASGKGSPWWAQAQVRPQLTWTNGLHLPTDQKPLTQTIFSFGNQSPLSS
jgi:hypothetical protein